MLAARRSSSSLIIRRSFPRLHGGLHRFYGTNNNNDASVEMSSLLSTPLCVLGETEQITRDMIRQFVRTQLPRDRVMKMDKDATMDPDLIKECFANGLFGVEIPEQYGGSALSFTSCVSVIEELARMDPALSVMVDVHNTLVNRLMMQYGTDAQRAQWLPRLAQDTIGSFCLSEVESGSDAFALKARAEDKGTHYLLNGTKMWITNAHEAGVFLVMANVNPSLGYKGITAFIVPRDTPGLTVGKKEDKLGIRASSTCPVILEDVKVPKDAVLGTVGQGYKIAIQTLNEGRIGIGAQMVGLAQGAYDVALPYIQQRTQFGKPVADFQAMQVQYAKAAVDIQAARLLVYEAARMKEAGMTFTHNAAMAKYFASEVAGDVSAKAIEWMGGVGFTREAFAEKFYRDSIVGKIYEGTSNMNLITIAKHIQEQYKNNSDV